MQGLKIEREPLRNCGRRVFHISNLRRLSLEEGCPHGHRLFHSFSQPGQGKGLLQSIPSDSWISTAFPSACDKSVECLSAPHCTVMELTASEALLGFSVISGIQTQIIVKWLGYQNSVPVKQGAYCALVLWSY